MANNEENDSAILDKFIQGLSKTTKYFQLVQGLEPLVKLFRQDVFCYSHSIFLAHLRNIFCTVT